MAEAIVEHDYRAKQPDELTIKKGDVIREVVKKQEGWCEGVLDGRRGLFPDNFVMLMQVKMRANSNALRKCRVIYSYKQEHEDELSLSLGDVIEIVGEEEEGWWKGMMNGRVGVFPSNFVEEMQGKEDANGERDHKDIVPVAKDKEEVKSSKILCDVKYAYQAQNSDELTLKEGDVVTLISKDGQDAGWWRGELDGKVGVFPDNFVVLAERPESDEKRPATNHAKTHVASQRKSQEIKARDAKEAKVDASPPPGVVAGVPPIVPNKKPLVPFKKSPSGAGGGLFSSLTGITKKIADTIDGAASSKSMSMKIGNDADAQREATESYHAFDNIERNPVLQDPRATRVKGPGRRPLSVVLKDGDGFINGNSDYGSLEDATLPTEENQAHSEIKPKSIDVQKPPWLDEMNKKMNMNKRTSSSPVQAPERASRLEASTASVEDAKSPGNTSGTEVSPMDMSKSLPSAMFSQPRAKLLEKHDKPEVKPKTPPNELERTVSVEKVVMRTKPVVNVRPQSIEAPGRKTSPTIHKSPSPSPKPPIADRTSVEVLNTRHFSDLSERLLALEAEMQRQREEYTAALEDLKGRLQVESDMRMLLQVELEKLQAQL